MKSSSIKINYIFTLFNTLTGLLFPLVTFPYVSRILFADGIGQIQFLQSIIDYVVLCTSLGIPLYAVREIARVRDDKKQCSKTVVEILILHSILSLFGYIIIFILAHYVHKIEVERTLFYLLSTTLFFTAIGVNWFYQAVEDFKYITIRSLLVRIFSLVCLFVFVKTKDDLLIYAAISVFSLVGSNIFNFFRLRKYIDFSVLHDLKIKRHLLPSMKIFALNLTISIYVNLDSVMLGFLKDQQAVGYYAAATRVTKSVLGVVTSLGTVLLPRFSNLIAAGKFDEFSVLANKSINYVIALSFPMCIGLIFLSKPIILLFAGNSFDSSILTMQIIAPIIVFIAFSGIIGLQILYPQGKEKIVIYSTAVGAVINFSINYFCIPIWSQNGAALGTIIAEFSVILVMFILGRSYLPIHLFSRINLNYVLATLIMSFPLFMIVKISTNNFITLMLSALIGPLIYFLVLYFLKDPFIIGVKQIIQKKIYR